MFFKLDDDHGATIRNVHFIRGTIAIKVNPKVNSIDLKLKVILIVNDVVLMFVV